MLTINGSGCVCKRATDLLKQNKPVRNWRFCQSNLPHVFRGYPVMADVTRRHSIREPCALIVIVDVDKSSFNANGMHPFN